MLRNLQWNGWRIGSLRGIGWGLAFGLVLGVLDSPAQINKAATNPTSEEARSHWCFEPIRLPALPREAAPGAHPIDAFISARLAAKHVTPNGRASRQELIRRAYYDLTGLPPTPEEVDAFVADTSQDSWERLVDRLLASPHYGEKWGRHWLDLVRFAESNSYERDGGKPNAWRYRDYVIRSFNEDKPYDRFILEQLAGDELPSPSADAWIATGFYRLGIWDDEPADPELARFDSLDDIVTTTGQVFLGLTVDCARCHNHKIDPIPQADYYRLLAFFHNITPYKNGGPTDEVPIFASDQDREAYRAKVREIEHQRQEVSKELESARTTIAHLAPPEEQAALTSKVEALENWMRGPGTNRVPAGELTRYQTLKKKLEDLKPESVPVEKALAVSETGNQPPETFVLNRGNPNLKGDKVQPGFLTVLGHTTDAPKPSASPESKTTQRRTLLAKWLGAPENPLTARVWVNRLWQYHFGRGIVRSPNNFGMQGDRPTHPELLDWLASELLANGWRTKAIHRLIMTSEAYQRSSRGNADALNADPANDGFWRFDMRRLTAEEIRDTLLSITGTLNPKMYGPGVYVDIPKEVLAGQSQPGNGWGHSSPEEQARRSVYIHVKRSLLTPILESFDMAETDRSAPVRFSTVQPTQALGMLNGGFLHQQAQGLAQRVQREVGSDLSKQLQRVLYLVTQRPPRSSDVERGLKFVREVQSRDGVTADTALKDFCLLALNLNEMMFLD